jgi:MFS transporter, PAT family, beta-lactamase induction signal transducer AmpG
LAAGSLVGGILILRLKIYMSLFLFGIVQAIAVFGFALLALIGNNLTALSAVIGFDNFAIGMGTSAFVAYMASLTNKKFSATQFALLSSFMGIPRTILVTPTGWMAEQMGWFSFFTFCTLICIPGILLIYWLKKSSEKNLAASIS